MVNVLVGSHDDNFLLVFERSSFRDLMELFLSSKCHQILIAQNDIGDCPGQDLWVSVIGGQVVVAMLRRNAYFSFNANITRGGCGEFWPMELGIELLV